jgi:hypothetical protein
MEKRGNEAISGCSRVSSPFPSPTWPNADVSTQLGFVLNLEQHWFTLRRFGHPKRKGHWFNLNSFLQSPEWVGSTYLGMVLQQAEKEGMTSLYLSKLLI